MRAAQAAKNPVIITEIMPNGTIRLIHTDGSPSQISDYDRWEREL